MKEYTEEEINRIVETQRAYFRSNETLDIDFRKKQLIRLRDAVQNNEERLKQALYDDLGRHGLEAYFVI